MVTIVISYQPGTVEMLEVCLASIHRHTWVSDITILVITTKISGDMKTICERYDALPMEVEVPETPVSRLHGRMLDTVIPFLIDTEYVLTLDSDCFPIADGWLIDLLAMMNNARLVGILHPFGPPPDDMLRMKLMWRVWSQHNWTNTHVACQLLRVADYRELQDTSKVSYAGGDDTGLLVPLRAKEKGWTLNGYRPTRCPFPDDVDGKPPFDPEFNRLHCVVFGDKMCHVGAYSRGKGGMERPNWEYFDWALKRILDEKGAEFLLDDRESYIYQFDREDEVAKQKMDDMLGVSADGRSIRQL